MSERMALGRVWRQARDQLRAAGNDEATTDAKRLAEAAFGLSSLALATGENEPVGPDDRRRYDALVARRLAGEPVARILGRVEFYGLDFALNAATLVPRPETELLVEIALERLGTGREGKVLDLGTGSGCIPIALLAERADLQAVATDLSADALAMARQNAKRNGVAERLELLEGSWFAALGAEREDRFDVIVSNPPYIETGAIAGLMREVRDHDPALALDGGVDGLAPYREIVGEAARWLAPGGWLILEIGSDQGEDVAALFVSGGFGGSQLRPDLAGLDRVVVGHHIAGART